MSWDAGVLLAQVVSLCPRKFPAGCQDQWTFRHETLSRLCGWLFLQSPSRRLYYIYSYRLADSWL